VHDLVAAGLLFRAVRPAQWRVSVAEEADRISRCDAVMVEEFSGVHLMDRLLWRFSQNAASELSASVPSVPLSVTRKASHPWAVRRHEPTGYPKLQNLRT